ncbi:MAG: glycoside hydrolase family 125 protein [Thermoguttaceae bacterium]
MNRRDFLRGASVVASTAVLGRVSFAAADQSFPVVRTATAMRKFRSEAVERTIAEVKSSIGNKELAWLFENCFPNTLDTTVDYSISDGKPDTYVITGDIDAMWQRDSTAQVWPYVPLAKDDEPLRRLIEGTIRRQTRNILKDPYANAFYKDASRQGPWRNDKTEMKPGVHERKWEIDSLCYPIRLAYGYWKATGESSPFDDAWQKAMLLVLRTFQEQQRKHGPGPYRFLRCGCSATDTLPGGGYGRPCRPVGLICSMFRPSDDATVFPFLVPSNFFAVVSLRQAAEMLERIRHDGDTASRCRALADEVANALRQYAAVNHPQAGKVYAFEVDGFGNHYCIDDANAPNLLSLPYLGAVERDDPVYQSTRRLILSDGNPYFSKGKAGEGTGGPHVGRNMIWPLGITLRALTSDNDAEISACLALLQRTHAGTGFMHEAFDRDDARKFTRPWFAWANSLFGELILKLFKQRPRLLQ